MTYFGEIVEPSSRSACEYWDDINLETQSNLQWQKNHEFGDTFDNIFILEGSYFHECAKSLANKELDLIDTISDINLNLYRLKNSGKYICTVKEYDLIYSTEVIELLRKYITSEAEVIGVVIKPIQQYQTQELQSSNCIIRIVTTSVYPKIFSNLKYERLEQPNIISGISAGAVTLRENLGLAGAVIVCYTELSEEYHIEDLHQLFKNLNISTSFKRSNSIFDSNLYV